MLALSIRQPYAELILRGIKTVELRSRPTRIIGRRFLIYAAKSRARPIVWSNDLAPAKLPRWMKELAKQVKLIGEGEPLDCGVIVGSAVIWKVQEVGGIWAWHLKDVKRLRKAWTPKRAAQPVWFHAA